ncbi:hypothetical protein HDE_01408 [Halotydeus destructor]|nr:hypothetical protein HDE_01408 [Halotydeus destructor]
MGAVRDGHADEQNFKAMGANGSANGHAETGDHVRQGSLRSNVSAESDRHRTGHQRFGSFIFRHRGRHVHRHSKDNEAQLEAGHANGQPARYPAVYPHGLEAPLTTTSQGQMQAMSHLRPHETHGRGRSRSPSPRRRHSNAREGGPRRDRSPTPIGRSMSPHVHPDHTFADAVHDLVDEVHYHTSRRGRARAKLLGDEFVPLDGAALSRRRGSSRRRSHSPWRGYNGQEKRDHSSTPEYKTTCLDRRSRTPSPSQKSPPKILDYYGTTQLDQRSRSPSPSDSCQSQWTIAHRRHRGRRLPLPPGPLKAMAYSCLQAIGVGRRVEVMNMPTLSHSPTLPQPATRSPPVINFPKVSGSPTPDGMIPVSSGPVIDLIETDLSGEDVNEQDLTGHEMMTGYDLGGYGMTALYDPMTGQEGQGYDPMTGHDDMGYDMSGYDTTGYDLTRPQPAGPIFPNIYNDHCLSLIHFNDNL